jgi:hypothetical protein
LLSLLVALVFTGTGAHAGTIEVPGDQPTIQMGIDAALNGDTVLVAPAIYTENITFRGKKIVVTSHYAMDQDTIFMRSTVIDGSNPANPDTASCVRFISGEDSTSVLQGFTLTGGTGTRWLDEHGAGTYVEGGGILVALCSPTIRNNIIVGNKAARKPTGVASAGGGGIRCGDGSPTIENNIITGNAAYYGGGIVMNYATGTIRNNVITNNVVYQEGSAPSYGGGGIWVNGAGGTVVENNTVAGNSVTGGGVPPAGRGGGMVVSGTSVTARNNVFWGNTQVTGGPIYVGGPAPIVMYNDVEGGYTGEGNIDADPLFTAPSYYLDAESPCIDAGDTSAVYNDPEDPFNPGFAQWPSLGTLRNDMGAFGGPHRMVLGSVPTAIEGDEPGVNLPRTAALGQNFPNPFNPSTTITFSLSQDAEVTLVIYSLRGKEVRTLVQGTRNAGVHVAHWDGRDGEGKPAGSGIYFYRLTSGDAVTTKKMLLVK